METASIFSEKLIPVIQQRGATWILTGFCWPSACSLERHNSLLTEARCASPTAYWRSSTEVTQAAPLIDRGRSVEIRLDSHANCRCTGDLVGCLSKIMKIIEDRSGSGIPHSSSSELTRSFASLLAGGCESLGLAEIRDTELCGFAKQECIGRAYLHDTLLEASMLTIEERCQPGFADVL